ncbi:MAG: ATP-binding protein [Oscillospiraceae bacterium]|nr:ATP-binding protein [Oscillospiraceae bacterium]
MSKEKTVKKNKRVKQKAGKHVKTKADVKADRKADADAKAKQKADAKEKQKAVSADTAKAIADTKKTKKTKKRWLKLGLRAKLLVVFIAVMALPTGLFTFFAWDQISALSDRLRTISVDDSSVAINDIARNNIERMTTDTAAAISEFLYQRDQDIRLLANLIPSDTSYEIFSENRNGNIMPVGEWILSDDGNYWIEAGLDLFDVSLDISSNVENNDIQLGSGFNYRPPEIFSQYPELIPLYDEITYIDLSGQEIFKYVNPDTTKVNYPLNPQKVDVSDKMNTYVRAETYWQELLKLKPGEIYVSDVIGAYVGTNYIGTYTPGALKNDVPETHPNYEQLLEIANLPAEEFIKAARQQAFASLENPVGQRFEGIVRWATPVMDADGDITGYVTMALNHDHIMEFVDHITPMSERYTVVADAGEGNYAFIWDYKCRSIAHPRHHSIVGYNPITGEPQVPWLEGGNAMYRDTSNGGFLLDDDNSPIPILDLDGNTMLADDTPFYFWYTNGGQQWLESNPSWNNLSGNLEGTSWGAFYEAHKDDREILPQFGERAIRDGSGNIIIGNDGAPLLDYQSRLKTPARALTAAGFVGLDGRYLNNAPQCTGWMDLTKNGGSGSFYILWSGLYKPTTAGAIPYYTGQYSPETQGNLRGFAFVAIGAGIEDFTAPVADMEASIIGAINDSMDESIIRLALTSLAIFLFVVIVSALVASATTKNIKQLVTGLYRFRMGDRSFRINSKANDEFGALADSFDDMADSVENSVKTPLVITDMDFTIVYANQKVFEALGKTAEEIVGTRYYDVSVYPFDSVYDPIKALNEGRDADIMHREEDNRYFMGKANFLYDHEGEKCGYIILTTDVSDIQIARRRAESASAAKSNFLSNMSHEIRTPLNAILGMTTIGEGSDNLEKKDYALRQIHNASSHLLGIINDILDVSKIEANKFALSPVSFSLEEMLEKVIDMISFRVNEKNQILDVNVDKNIQGNLLGDDQRLSQVLMNVLSNAVKFTDYGGEICLDVSLESEEDDYYTIRTQIQDNGIGISQEQQKRLFESFEQAEASTSRRFGGTGLGLMICKSIVEMMDGRIWVESEVGKGSKVSFTARLARDKRQSSKWVGRQAADSGEIQDEAVSEAISDANEDFTGHTVLLVEDVEINCEIVIALLEHTHLTIECAKNGIVATKMFEANPEKYDMIFMDIQMPEMDGYTATKLIRQGAAARAKDIPIIAMTANVFKEDIDKCMEAGMNGHIGKPVSYDKVIAIINKYLKQ